MGFMGSFNLRLVFFIFYFYVKLCLKKKKIHSHGGDLFQDPRNC